VKGLSFSSNICGNDFIIKGLRRRCRSNDVTVEKKRFGEFIRTLTFSVKTIDFGGVGSRATTVATFHLFVFT